MGLQAQRANHHSSPAKHDKDRERTNYESPFEDNEDKTKRRKFRKTKKYTYHTPHTSQTRPPTLRDDKGKAKASPASRVYRSESRIQSQSLKKKRKGRRRSRSISINIRTEVPPPCECDPQSQRQTQVVETPCHRRWQEGYHPASRISAYSEKVSSSISNTISDDESEYKRSIQYRPVYACTTTDRSGPVSLITRLTKGCTEDRGTQTQIGGSEASTVNITVTMADKEQLQDEQMRRLAKHSRESTETFGETNFIPSEPPKVNFEEFLTRRGAQVENNPYNGQHLNEGFENKGNKLLRRREALKVENEDEPGPGPAPLIPRPPPIIPPRRIDPNQVPTTPRPSYDLDIQGQKVYQNQLDSFAAAVWETDLPREDMRSREPNPPQRHVFPFRETPSGNLKIESHQISFESPKVAVLVADPDRTRLNVQDEHKGVVVQSIQTSVVREDLLLPNNPPPPLPPQAPSDDWHSHDEHRDVSPSPPFPSTSTGARSRPQSVIDRGYETEPSFPTNHYGGRESKGSKTFMENLHHRLKRAINPDTKIRIGSKEFPVHGIALQCYSEYFDKLRRPKSQIVEVQIPEEVMSSSDFPSLMDWILMEECEKHGVIDKGNVVSLFSGATYLRMSQLRDDCMTFIRDKVEDGDPFILNMYEEARARNSQELISLLSMKLAGLFPRIYQSRQFLNLSPREIILILNADNIAIHSELDVYDAGVRWLLYDWERRKGYTVDIMKSVRFGFLTPLQLTQLRHSAEATSLPNYPQIFSFPEVTKLVEEATTYAILKESYQGHPGELQRWLRTTGVVPPKERRNLRLSTLPQPTDTELSPKVQFSTLEPKSERKEKKSKKKKSISQEVLENSSQRLGEGNVLLQPHYNVQKVDPDTIYTAEVEAATVIQKAARGWLARKHYSKLRKAALVTQAAFRASQKKIPIKPIVPPRTRDEKILILGGSDPSRPIDATNPATSIFLFSEKTNSWKPRGHLPQPRTRIGTAHIGNFIYIFGGEDPTRKTKRDKNIASGSTWSLDLENGKWKQLSEMNVARSYFGYALAHGKIYVFGGMDQDQQTLESCEVYDPREDKWRRIRSMNGPRLNVAVANSGGKIWVVGGFTKELENQLHQSVIIYDTNKNVFYSGPELPFPRCSASLITYYDQLILIGGATLMQNNEIGSISDVSRLIKNEWVSVGNLKTGPKHGHCALRIGKYVLILGGVKTTTEEATEEVESFNIEKFRGSTTVSNLPQRLSGLSGVVIH